MSVFDKNGYPQVDLKVNKNGDGVVTVGEEGKPEVIIASSENGGIVSTYGKD